MILEFKVEEYYRCRKEIYKDLEIVKVELREKILMSNREVEYRRVFNFKRG